ncbi:MAG: hypothetical protein CBD49_01020 [Acidimicrobiaceae bacterium TMED189]|nr:MAG: hypothetical protein CBD49_01020 [Acidimicrobiaceae bacterium TMED189]|tara:strand:+ start:1183 stop:1461 length:279 start_codon:yes stop_codon:yes gene_type:complete
MSIEDVAERSVVWAEALKKISKAAAGIGVAIAGAISAFIMLWPSGGDSEPSVRTDLVPGYGPQCSQLYNTIEHTWTEAQWSVWESLRKDLNC